MHDKRIPISKVHRFPLLHSKGLPSFYINISKTINFVFHKNYVTKGNLVNNVKVFSIDMCYFISGDIFSPLAIEL